ncbi:DUF5687 family protein [Sphingobacterium sp. HJSM2_6]|uniref:DUF5687 family protein n=1 Tax=Sphingobacterium sp. HJSM2_6 TaxID=3366264 RepID=UPI003BE711FD
MIKELLTLEWKAFFRSASLGKNIAVKVFLGIMAIYFLSIFLLVGIGLYSSLQNYFPDTEPIYIVNKFLLYWLLVELVFRFIVQNIPIINVKPLLVQQISRSKIVHYVLVKSCFSFYNSIILFMGIPFIWISISKNSLTPFQFFSWLIALFFSVLFIQFLSFIVQRWFASNLKAMIIFLFVIAGIYLLEYLDVFSLATLTGRFFDSVLLYPWLALVPIFLSFMVYSVNHKQILAYFYVDAYLKEKHTDYKASDLTWTNRFGALAPFLQLDLKLIWRNKRSKSTIYLGLLFLLYGLIFYPNETYQQSTILVFVGIFITGIFMINFGQFIPAWDSTYYSMLMVQNIPMRLYLEAKVLLMVMSICILTILSSAYVYFGWNIFLINISCALYNLGVNIPIILFFGSYNKKRIDLNASSMMNYQGMGIAQWIVGIPILLIPMIIWGVTKMFTDEMVASSVLGILGIVGLVLRKPIMAAVTDQYLYKKHKTIAGFKEVQS